MYQFRSNPLVAKFAASKGSIIDLTAAAVADLSYVCVESCQVMEVSLIITTAIVSSGAVVVTVRKRPTPGSSAGQSTVAVLTTGLTDAVGKVRYKLPSPVSFSVGQEMIYEVTTASAGGGAAGQAVGGFVAYESPELPANNSNMLAG